MGIQNDIATLENNLVVSYKVKYKFTIQTIISLLRTYPKKNETYVRERLMHEC